MITRSKSDRLQARYGTLARNREVLRLWLDGVSYRQISIRLEVSYSRVYEIIRRAKDQALVEQRAQRPAKRR